MKHFPVSRVAADGVLVAFALILSYIEAILPINGLIPGIKPGLANICALLLLYRVGFWDALGVNILRVILSNLLFGSLMSMAFGLAGGIGAVLLMGLLSRCPRFSPLGAGIAGGALHNLLQLGVAALVTRSAGIWSYGPVLLFSGTLCGALTGGLSLLILRKLPRHISFNRNR